MIVLLKTLFFIFSNVFISGMLFFYLKDKGIGYKKERYSSPDYFATIWYSIFWYITIIILLSKKGYEYLKENIKWMN